jgi:hypothetical protein
VPSSPPGPTCKQACPFPSAPEDGGIPLHPHAETQISNYPRCTMSPLKVRNIRNNTQSSKLRISPIVPTEPVSNGIPQTQLVSAAWLCGSCCSCCSLCRLPSQLPQVAAHLLVLTPVAALVLLATVVGHLGASRGHERATKAVIW